PASPVVSALALPDALPILLWAGEAVAWLTVLGICVALVWLCVRISRQRPFGRSVTTALNWVAVLVIVGGTTSGVLADFGRGTVVDRKITRLNSSHVKISYA